MSEFAATLSTATEIVVAIIFRSWTLLSQMAPYLLFGFFTAGILAVCLPSWWVEKHLSHGGFIAVGKAVLLGIPLPLCSCSVIPVAASLRRHGASRAATASFLIATPQTGVDSISITYAMFGGAFAVFRVLAAMLSGLLGGLLTLLAGPREQAIAPDGRPKPACSASCCAEKNTRSLPGRILRHGFLALPRDIGLPLLLGIVIAAAVTTLAPENRWQPYLGGGFGSILLGMALGVPIYVCATASVPIAAGLIHLGASPGAALAFLVAGPATNAATITTTWKFLGPRTALLYLLTIALSAIGGGLLLDRILQLTGVSLALHIAQPHHAEVNILANGLWAAALIAVLGIAFFIKADKPATDTILHTDSGSTSPLQKHEMFISGITCEHCVALLRQALAACSGISDVEIDQRTGRTIITGANINPQELAATVDSLGYKVL